MNTGLARRTFAEFLGTGLLAVVVIGSGIAAARLTPDPGLRLAINAGVTAAGLTVIILIAGPVSGAHLNPVVSIADWVLERRRGGIAPPTVAVFGLAQTAGAVAGAVLANVMYDEPAVAWSPTDRTGWGLWLGEVVATAGLVLLVFALVRTERAALAAPAVGAYIGAAYWFTSSTSFANPALTVGRAFTDTYAGIAPASVAGFIGAQVVGAALGVAAAVALYPKTTEKEATRVG